MKESGVEWIGEIPEGWNIIKLKYSSTLKGRIGWQGLRANEFVEDGPFLITGTDFESGFVNWDTCAHISDKRYSQDINIHIKEDDLLVTKDGTVGKTAIAKNCPEKVSLNSGVFIVRNDGHYNYESKYLYYVIGSDEFYTWYDFNQQGNSTIKHLTQERFYNFSFTLPPIHEQKAIADFLDAKCTELDALCDDIQAEIDTLEEYKKSVITEAVTKGINPNAEMKDSGIEWVGCVPKDWDVMANKYVMKKLKILCPVYHGEDILSLSMKGVIVRDLDAGGKMPASFNGYQKLFPGNLLMCLFDYDVTPRCIGLIKNDGLTSPAYSQFTMLNGNSSRYYYYYYLMIDNTKALLHLAKNLRYSFTENELGVLNVPVPPLDEQKAIADYLDAKCTEIDVLISEKKEQLETLAEYKKSLIYEYVTGKKEIYV